MTKTQKDRCRKAIRKGCAALVPKGERGYGVTEMADRLSVKQSAVSNWIIRGRVPDTQVLPFCEACGFAVTPTRLRPDLYPPHLFPESVWKAARKTAA